MIKMKIKRKIIMETIKLDMNKIKQCFRQEDEHSMKSLKIKKTKYSLVCNYNIRKLFL